MTKPKWKRLFRMKWLPTLAAALTVSALREKRWVM